MLMTEVSADTTTLTRSVDYENRNLSCLMHHGGCERVASKGTQVFDDLRSKTKQIKLIAVNSL